MLWAVGWNQPAKVEPVEGLAEGSAGFEVHPSTRLGWALQSNQNRHLEGRGYSDLTHAALTRRSSPKKKKAAPHGHGLFLVTGNAEAFAGSDITSRCRQQLQLRWQQLRLQRSRRRRCREPRSDRLRQRRRSRSDQQPLR